MEGKTKNRKRDVGNEPNTIAGNPKGGKGTESKSAKLAKKEVRTALDYSKLMATLMTDVIAGDISPRTVNAAVNAGRQIIKVAELNLKYGKKPKQIMTSKQETGLNLLTGEIH